jgi:hypothetical protein
MANNAKVMPMRAWPVGLLSKWQGTSCVAVSIE